MKRLQYYGYWMHYKSIRTDKPRVIEQGIIGTDPIDTKEISISWLRLLNPTEQDDMANVYIRFQQMMWMLNMKFLLKFTFQHLTWKKDELLIVVLLLIWHLLQKFTEIYNQLTEGFNSRWLYSDLQRNGENRYTYIQWENKYWLSKIR